MRFSVNFFQVSSPIAFFLTFSSPTQQDTHVDTKSSSLRALTCEKIALLTKNTVFRLISSKYVSHWISPR